jgi:hypothetical protein
LILGKTIMATSGERVLSMWSLNRNRILGTARSPVAFGAALLAVTLLATMALTLSPQAPISLADFASAICSQRFQSASEKEASYLAENVSAMTKMMSDMGVRPSGDIDRDFVAMMTPHHQGAIAMARAELRYGHNEQLSTDPTGAGALEPLQNFMTNPAGAAVVNAIGLIRQVVRGEDQIPRRYLVIVPGAGDNHGAPAQVQME